MDLYAQAYTLHPAWVREPRTHQGEIARFALSFVDPEERLEQHFLPALSHEDALALLLDLAERCREAEGRVTLAEHHAQMKEDLKLRIFLNNQADKLEQYQAEAERCRVLFAGLCWALGRTDFSFTGGELSQVRRGIPAELAEALEGLKRIALPDGERLTAEDTAALFEGLRSAGLVSGSLAAFSYHLGPLSSRKPKGPESALSWTGRPTLFAFFAWRFALYTQGPGYTNRAQALCAAFGIDERARRNTILPVLADLRPAERPDIEGSGAIDKLFQALPGFSTK